MKLSYVFEMLIVVAFLANMVFLIRAPRPKRWPLNPKPGKRMIHITLKMRLLILGGMLLFWLVVFGLLYATHTTFLAHFFDWQGFPFVFAALWAVLSLCLFAQIHRSPRLYWRYWLHMGSNILLVALIQFVGAFN